ncbi:hypothetical protein KFE98_16285 [bacterium SCSIO 12741]|nr:hypothetical protein KFE98_16285 [bacterium SCSIO 12741]
MIRLPILLLTFLLSGLQLLGQETNYWSNQIGSKSALIGGAVTASVRDNSAVYYNPGALAYMKKSSFSLSTDIYTLDNLFIENGAGQGINLSKTWLGVTPNFISGGLKIKGAPFATLNYAAFSVHENNFDLKSVHNGQYDVLSIYDGKEYYQGNFDYRSNNKEDWIGVGFGLHFKNYFAIGVSTFLTLRQLHNITSLRTNLLSDQTLVPGVQIVGSTGSYREIRHFHAGNVWKVGVATERDKISLGASITTPRWRIPVISSATVERHYEEDIDGQPTVQSSYFNEKVNANFKSPWIVDLGMQWAEEKTIYSFRVAFFSGIEPYALNETVDPVDVTDTTLRFANREFQQVWTANRPLVNFAVGLERKLNDQVSVLSGFRTDFNYMDFDKLDPNEKWVASINYWNTYHISGGIELITKNGNDIVLGVNYAFGRSKGDLQLISLTDPLADNGLTGELQTNTSSVYQRLSLVLGLALNFHRRGQAPEEE